MKLLMHSLLAVCVVATVPALRAQEQGPAMPQSNDVEVRGNGHCTPVRPGDLVHFSLTVDGVANAKAVFADLQLTTGHATYHETDLPMPGSGVLGGGGTGSRDDATSKVYRFSFHVPVGAMQGVYRSAGLVVTADYGTGADKGAEAYVDRHAREQVRRYCLVVFGPAQQAPVVTDFKPGEVEHK